MTKRRESFDRTALVCLASCRSGVHPRGYKLFHRPHEFENALGLSVPETLAAMREGKCGIGPLEFRDVERLAIRIGGSQIEPTAMKVMPDSIVAELPQIVRGESVEIDLQVNVFENPYLFKAFVGHTDDMEVWQQVDPSDRAATTVFLPDVPAATRLLDKLEISPKVLTPNGDGVGDLVEIRFALLKTDAPVEVKIYSLDGQLVGSLTGTRTNDGFLRYPWDGIDKSGRKVPPGTYVVRLKVDAQVNVDGLAQIINVAY